MQNIDPYLLTEQKLIFLMLKSKRIVDSALDVGINQDFFSDRHRLLVECILKEYLNADSIPRLLTRDAFHHMLLSKFGASGEVLAFLKVYDTCIYKVSAVPDDFGFLKTELMNGYAARFTRKGLQNYEKQLKTKGAYAAARDLVDELSIINSLNQKKNVTFATLQDAAEDYISLKKNQRENPASVIKCGIDEFDSVMVTGPAVQTLTLIVADTGVGKTACMLSMGINMAKNGHNVLFISLEMPRDHLMNRLVANQSPIITLDKISQPHLMTDAEVQEMEKIVRDFKHNFAILDNTERMTVSMLRREIEIRAMVFKPEVVFVDYIGIVKPENRYRDRNDLELGDISKDLRFLGKKYGFGVVSACQLNREAIRRMRKSKESLAGSEDIRGSGELPNDADYLFALYPTEEGNKVKGQCVKSRHSGTKKSETFSLYFDGSHCKFGNWNPTAIAIENMNTDFLEDVSAEDPYIGKDDFLNDDDWD